MEIDVKTVKRIASLARIEVKDEELQSFSSELSKIIAFMEELNELELSNVLPMTSVSPMSLYLREDEVTEGNSVDKILENAPKTSEGFFTVPKVIE